MVARMATSLTKGGVLFFAANFVGAVFNYLFQVISSRQLTTEGFADLNGWFANVSLFYILGAFLQFGAAFNPARKKILRAIALASSGIGAVFILLWNLFPASTGNWHAVLIVSTVIALGWLTGQAQIRLKFGALALMGFTIATSRVAMTFYPSGADALAKYVFINFVVYVFAIWILAGALVSAEDVQVPLKSGNWQNAILLSIAAVVIPQFDMFLMNHTQPKADFAEFTRASLFGRGVFAIISITAQWLLPSQIRNGEGVDYRKIWMGVVAALALSGLVAGCSTFVAGTIFNWQDIPAKSLVFLASAEISILAVTFMAVHALCAQHNFRAAFIILAVLGLEGMAQLVFKFPMFNYLIVAMVIQIITILGVSATAASRPKSGS